MDFLHLIYFSKYKNMHDFDLGTTLGLCFFKYPILLLKITVEKKKKIGNRPLNARSRALSKLFPPSLKKNLALIIVLH